MRTTVLLLAVFAGAALTAAEQAAAQQTAVQAKPAAVQPAAVQQAPVQAKPAAVQQAPVQAKPAAVQPAPVQAQPAVQKEEEPGIAFCLARGLCNISTGWLEIPRCMVYDNSAIPVFGMIVGIPEGAMFMVARTFCGVFDLLSFGASGSACHGKVFPNTVFQSKWLSK